MRACPGSARVSRAFCMDWTWMRFVWIFLRYYSAITVMCSVRTDVFRRQQQTLSRGRSRRWSVQVRINLREFSSCIVPNQSATEPSTDFASSRPDFDGETTFMWVKQRRRFCCAEAFRCPYERTLTVSRLLGRTTRCSWTTLRHRQKGRLNLRLVYRRQGLRLLPAEEVWQVRAARRGAQGGRLGAVDYPLPGLVPLSKDLARTSSNLSDHCSVSAVLVQASEPYLAAPRHSGLWADTGSSLLTRTYRSNGTSRPWLAAYAMNRKTHNMQWSKVPSNCSLR